MSIIRFILIHLSDYLISIGIGIRRLTTAEKRRGERSTAATRELGEEKLEMVEWSMLPTDLLQLIGDLLLVNLSDYIRFRTACRSWRDASVDPHHYKSCLPRQHPWLMLSFDEFKNDRSFVNCCDRRVIKFHLPEAGNKRILGSTDGWLVLVSEALEIRLLNPLTRVEIPLPSMHEILNVVDYDEHDVGEEIKLREGNGDIVGVDSHRIRNLFLDKFMVSSIQTSGNQLLAMAIKWSGALLLTRLGDADSKWNQVVDQVIKVSDMVCFKGRTYVVDIRGVVSVCEYGPPPKLTPITTAIIAGSTRRWYLVESLGELLIVRRNYEENWKSVGNLCRKTRNFTVYKVDLENQQTKPIDLKCWDDRVLFVGANESASVSARDFPEWGGGGWICFTASYFRGGWSNEEFCVTGDDFGIFDATDESIDNCYDEDCPPFVWPPPFWFTPRLCLH